MRKKTSFKYPRDLGLIVNSGENVTSATFLPDGRLLLADKDGQPAAGTSVSAKISYEGENKRHEVAMTFDKEWVPQASFDPRRYEKVFACDTNTIMHQTEAWNLSITMVCEVNAKEVEGENLYVENKALFFIAWYWFGSENIEPWGWDLALRKIETSFKPDKEYRMIVDSEMSSLQSYNNRTALLPTGRPIPTNIQLTYASADHKDTYMNHAIRFCDKQASAILKDNGEAISHYFSSTGCYNRVMFRYGSFHRNEMGDLGLALD